MTRRKMRLSLFLAAVLALPLAAASAEIKIGAGAAPSENVFKPIKDAFEKSSGIKLNVISSGPKLALGFP